MHIVEQLFRTAFAIVTALLTWQITAGNEPWFKSVLGDQPNIVTTGILVTMLIVEIVVIWPMIRTARER